MDRRLMNTKYLQEQVNQLHKLHKHTVREYGDLVVSLNKEVDILCDIIPSYKISATMETDVRHKKEVHNVEKLEHEILTQYKHFLGLLGKLLKKSHPEQQALGSRLLCRLLPVAKEFNQNDVLLRLAVQYANTRVSRVAQPILKALEEVLDGEMVTETTQIIVEAILALVRKKQHAINPKLLFALLHIRIAMVDMHRKDIAEEAAKNKRLKKKDKELARQMMKANARRDRAELASKQTRIIHNLFVIYLRVLQASQSCSKEHQILILAPALEGLAKFAPLVNVEHFQLLMKALRELLDEEDNSVLTKLHSLIAVACLAKSDPTVDAADWRVDLAYFHNVLFQCLPDALAAPKSAKEEAKLRGAAEEEDPSDTASVGSSSTVGTLSSQAFSIAQSMGQQKFVKGHAGKEWAYRVSLVLRAVDLFLLTQRHIPIVRVTAFLRRIMMNTVSAPPHIAMSLMTLCHRLCLRYRDAMGILLGGNDYSMSGAGVFDPDAATPDTSYSDASFTWEVSLLVNSYHPTAKSVADTFLRHYHKLAKATAGAAPSQSRSLDALKAYEVLEQFSSAFGDIRPPPPHPSTRTSKRTRAAAEEEKKAKAKRTEDGSESGSESD